jgi:hypothetical protein
LEFDAMNVDGEDDAEAGAADGYVTPKQGPPTLLRRSQGI